MNHKKPVYNKPEFFLEEAVCEYMLAASPDGSGADMPIDDIEFQF